MDVIIVLRFQIHCVYGNKETVFLKACYNDSDERTSIIHMFVYIFKNAKQMSNTNSVINRYIYYIITQKWYVYYTSTSSGVGMILNAENPI